MQQKSTYRVLLLCSILAFFSYANSWLVSASEDASASAGSDKTGKVVDSDIMELEWDMLIPEGWNPETVLKNYQVDALSDDDPRAKQLMEKLQAMWKESPVVKSLDGKKVHLPGFIVPLDTDPKLVSDFLLVPYYGACIHVPPPPANQTVYVETRDGEGYKGQLFDVVWVTGTMHVKPVSSDLGDAGYLISAEKVEPYE